MKFPLLLIAAALLRAAEAFSTKTRHRGAESSYALSDDAHINMEGLSTDSFIAQFGGDVAVLVGGLVQDDSAEAAMSSPLNFFYSRKSEGSGSLQPSNKDIQKTVAECILTHHEAAGPKSRKIYLPLKDAEEYGKRIEHAKARVTPEPAMVTSARSEHGAARAPMDLVCKSVIISDDAKKCNVCLYAEILVPNKHVRYGHIGKASVLECLNGYDTELGRSGSSKTYFIDAPARYHPVCIAS
ncbi:hypothetical protein, conserved [Babesia bigemina]|uniref:Uncharacterized protein n=1 Tax=Babesia bigemina TaxID=5866 RepID=A0A061DAE9_BABBI|nr:hypothetical protein, conserved [Babesia bigemina]CDR95859.1 hypothetical protein, conserved [Babesia bigemina]|eukprot:XP_012768045.1 hypothetical protein, conserved [Babesia bigemina]